MGAVGTSGVQSYGIYISNSPNNTIGGSSAYRNIISANLTYGILITGSTSTGNIIKGNYIGINAAGTGFIPSSSQDYGIYLATSVNNNVIGGDRTAGEGNVISGNTNSGIAAESTDANGNMIRGNIIGPQKDGSTIIVGGAGAQWRGILIINSPNNTIGGSSVYRNIISANLSYGIYITGIISTGNTIKSNYIGIDSAGTGFIASSSQDYGIYLTSSANNDTIGGDRTAGEGNVISGNTNSGIYTESAHANGNIIRGNIIGPQKNGLTIIVGGAGAQSRGIYILNSPNNTIGGSSIYRNIISANLTYGVYITGISSTGNAIKGNYIGINAAGTGFITLGSQDYGIYLTADANNDTIGGDRTAGEGNVISGNTLYGIYINSTHANGNRVRGNIIGPQKDGSTIIIGGGGAQDYGIYISSSPNNTIGGSSVYRNIISANLDYGIYITGVSSTGNAIKSNYIGIDSAGTNFITSSSQDYGVYLTGSANNNTIGGDRTAGEGNVISGNTLAGIQTISADINGNMIRGNIIGPQKNGSTIIVGGGGAAQLYGIYINSSPNNTIGGSSIYRNIISANLLYGVYITGATSTGNTIKGNYIGIDSAGTDFITVSDQDYGIFLTASANNNVIGGDRTAGEGNVISGNILYGIYTNSTHINGNIVRGNIIGPQKDGSTIVAAAGVQIYGIFINSSPNNTIGGSSAYRNIISANLDVGVVITGITSTGNTIKGNYIGIDSAGTDFITSSSQDYGIWLTTSANNNVIGGDRTAGEGNVISGNTVYGIYTNSTHANGNMIRGNIIGPQRDGSTNVAFNEQTRGIYIFNSPNNIIGGSSAAYRNIISANLLHGVSIIGIFGPATGNVIKGNYIGIDSAGTGFIASSSQDYGIFLTGSANSNIIGGDRTAGEGNVISGNTNTGIFTESTHANGNMIRGNIIGPQKDGSTIIAIADTQTYGIYIDNSPNNIIGGSSIYRNIISANLTYGIRISGSSSTGNTMQGNYIGSATDLTKITSAAQDIGVYILSSANSNTIGGWAAGEGNIIAFNTTDGISITGAGSNFNLISRNSIYDTTAGGMAGLPINLNGTGNDNYLPPTIDSANGTTVWGTADSVGDTVEVYLHYDGVGGFKTTTAGKKCFALFGQHRRCRG